MRAEHINPFYRATRDVFQVMLRLETTRQALRAVEELAPVHEVNVVIGVTGGDLKGSLLYSFPKKHGFSNGTYYVRHGGTKLDAFVTSALAEVANIISGNAATYFSQDNLTCNIAPLLKCWWAKAAPWPWPPTKRWYYPCRPMWVPLKSPFRCTAPKTKIRPSTAGWAYFVCFFKKNRCPM